MKKTSLAAYLVSLVTVFAGGKAACAGPMPTGNEYTNSIGMKLVRIEPGEFQMGQIETPLPSEVLPIFRGRGLFDTLNEGDYDEKPTHTVKIIRPLYIGVVEVTNYQYEIFRPEHKDLRGKEGFSKEDDEAVTFVNWFDAKAFCQWLSDQEGLPYRLPTEAEWEYACRAGTTTNYYTGPVLPDSFLQEPRPEGGGIATSSLKMCQTQPNAWGLYNMHGGLEEWCYDWYGPYRGGTQVDPVGYAHGEFRVTRGGSHGSEVYYLRSANRLGAVPETRNWVTGFRVVIGELPDTKPLPVTPRRHQQNVVPRDRSLVSKGPDPETPYFRGPLRYVNMPQGSNGPVYTCHNHDPAIVECPNGDLLSIWYTCHDEHGRELAIAASRLRWGADEWEEASLFFWVPDRNNHAPALWFDDKNTLYHFSGVSAAKSRSLSAVAMRTSTDSGATWSAPRLILPEFTKGHLPTEPVFRMNNDAIVFAIDGPDTLFMSGDEGLTWFNPGGDIPGIHAGVTQLSDGTIFAFSRGYAVEGKMPISVSTDGGKSFTSYASEFPTVGGGQRLALLKLRSGELFLASFSNEGGKGIHVKDTTGNEREIRGLYAALSPDDGKTWPYKRLITDDGPARTIECTDGAAITMSARCSEYRGYLSACQSLDGLINVISSRNHFSFNTKWLKSLPPAPVDEPREVKPLVETFSGPTDFDNDSWLDYKGPIGGFNGKGQYTLKSGSHFNGINRHVGTGSFEAVFEITNIQYNAPGPRIPEGVTLGFRDAVCAAGETMFINIKQNEITLRDKYPIALPEPAKSAKIKFTYDDATKRWRVFYGLNGEEPVNEFQRSKVDGIYFGESTSESNAAYVLMSQGSVDFDYFEIKTP
ncbi:MAG TPA: SUMF1/EgtB/PvdO family nonheme iron enzyme [Sedimentisphaerales bacterium]|nr:SUMF1/EgtB/PvdO family nonheme iron enzyme [Sedimentisphaerales bacterium]